MNVYFADFHSLFIWYIFIILVFILFLFLSSKLVC